MGLLDLIVNSYFQSRIVDELEASNKKIDLSKLDTKYMRETILAAEGSKDEVGKAKTILEDLLEKKHISKREYDILNSFIF